MQRFNLKRRPDTYTKEHHQRVVAVLRALADENNWTVKHEFQEGYEVRQIYVIK